MTSRANCDDGWSLAGRMLDRREAGRLRLPRPVEVHRDGDRLYGRCLDLSDTGLKLELSEPLDPGDCVAVAFTNDVVLIGVVIWTRRRTCGVSLTVPVDSAAVLHNSWPQADLPATLALLGSRPQPRLRPSLPSAEPEGHAFKPGLAVTLIGARGYEERAVVSWTNGNRAALAQRTLFAENEPKLLPGT